MKEEDTIRESFTQHWSSPKNASLSSNKESQIGEEDTLLRKNHANSMDFIQEYEAQKKEDDLYLLSVIEKQMQGVLGEVQYIAEILTTHKQFAKVENINQKIKSAYDRIRAYLGANTKEELSDIQANRRTSGGISMEENPLIKDMGGMPLETISAEWQQEIDPKVLDKAELENLVRKAKEKKQLANKLAAKNKLTNKPALKAGHQLTPKFQKIRETVKYIVKQMPTPPAPAPKISIPPPRPPGA